MAISVEDALRALQPSAETNPNFLDFDTLSLDDKYRVQNALQNYNSAHPNDPLSIGADGNIDFSRLMQNNPSNFSNMLGWANVGLQGLGTLGNIWGGLQMLKQSKQALELQRDAFEFNKTGTTTNFNNRVAAELDSARKQNTAAAAQNTGATGSQLASIASTYRTPDLKTL